MSSNDSKNTTVRSFFISSDLRNVKLDPNPSDFHYELPVTLTNVEGVSIRDYKFRKETLVNRNNRSINIWGKKSNVSFNATVVLTVRDYTDISTLIGNINTAFTSALATTPASGVSVTFNYTTNDATTKLLTVNMTGTTSGDYLIIDSSSVMESMGFPSSSFCLYNTAIADNTLPVDTPAFNIASGPVSALGPYDLTNTSDMIVRINDIEAVLCEHPVINRATAVLFSAADSSTTSSKQCLDHYMPLLQPQGRVQRLRIRLLNIDGDLYDTTTASFLVRFYCANSKTSI